MLKILALAAFGAISLVGASQALGALDEKLRKPELRPASDTPEAVQTMAVAREETSRASGGAAQVSRSPDGHYWAEGQVNGRRVRFLVDTGATTVALTLADAERLGIRPTRADYVHPVVTANGEK